MYAFLELILHNIPPLPSMVNAVASGTRIDVSGMSV